MTTTGEMVGVVGVAQRASRRHDLDLRIKLPITVEYKTVVVEDAEDVMNREARAAIHGDVYLGVQAAINPTMVGIIAHVVEEGVLVLDQVEDIGEEINGSFEYYLLCHSYCMYFMSFNGDRSVRSV
jgi:hypothetical protein